MRPLDFSGAAQAVQPCWSGLLRSSWCSTVLLETTTTSYSTGFGGSHSANPGEASSTGLGCFAIRGGGRGVREMATAQDKGRKYVSRHWIIVAWNAAARHCFLPFLTLGSVLS